MIDANAMKAEIELELARRRQEAFRIEVDLYGGMDAWHAVCSARRAADPDNSLARVVLRLLRRQSDLRTWPTDDSCFRADKPLYAFWCSVAAAGKDAWREERHRVTSVQREAAKSGAERDRLLLLDGEAVKSLLPVWRAWGQVLLDAGVLPDNSAGPESQ